MKALDRNEFTGGMQKIFNQFGNKAYSDDRVSLIYREVHKLNSEQYTKLINDFLSGSRFAPLPKDFRDAAGNYISMNYQNGKKESSKRYKRLLSESELGTVFKALLQGLGGNFEALRKVVGGLNKLNQYSCKQCQDSGIVFAKPKDRPHSADFVFNCNCHLSIKNPNYNTWSYSYQENLINNVLRE